MMTAIPKSHEDRIADLERQVAELKRIVGVPPSSLGSLGAVMGVGVIRNPDGSVSNPQSLAQAHAQQSAQEAAQKAALAYQQARARAQESSAGNWAQALGNVAQADGNFCQAQNLNQCSAKQQEGQRFSGYENIVGSTQGMTVKHAATAASNAALIKVVAQCLHDMTSSKKGGEPTFIYGVPTMEVANEVIMTVRRFDYENRD